MNPRALFILSLLGSAALLHGVAQVPSETPQTLVKEVVYNEQVDHEHHGFYEYRVERKIGQQSQSAIEVETTTGRLNRIVALDGVPLNTEQQAEENRRLMRLVSDRSAQSKLKADYESDEQRIGSMMAMMPDAFLYDYDGVEGENVRLKFLPNPAFHAPTYDTRVFHELAGTIWVNIRAKRLAHMRCELIDDVQFGYGWLGHVDKGGTFEMVRTQVGPREWKTNRLDVHISGRMIMLKAIAKDQHEVRSRFRPVDGNLSLAAATELLDDARAKPDSGPMRAAVDRAGR